MHKDVHDFTNELNSYLMKRYGYKRPPAVICGEDKVQARRKKFDLYLRFKVDHETLTVARMYFLKTRSGNGTSLMRFLAEQAADYDYNKIRIEAANKNSASFAMRYGFSRIGRNDWIIELEVLKSVLYKD